MSEDWISYNASLEEKNLDLSDVKNSLKRVGEELQEALRSPPFVQSGRPQRLVPDSPTALWDSADEAALSTALLRWVFTALSRGWAKWREALMNRPSPESYRSAVAFWIRVCSPATKCCRRLYLSPIKPSDWPCHHTI